MSFSQKVIYDVCVPLTQVLQGYRAHIEYCNQLIVAGNDAPLQDGLTPLESCTAHEGFADEVGRLIRYVDGTLPAVETPCAETPAVETPVAETFPVDTPAVDAPTVDVPSVDVPAVDVPMVDLPVVDAPTADAPVVDDTVVNTINS